MITSPRATLSASGSAITARERLLQDKIVRAIDNRLLSSSEQNRQALGAARSFRNHYLSEIAFIPEDNITVAVVRPSAAQKDTSYAITVDATGNTNVEPIADHNASHQRMRRVMLGTSTIVLILALLIFAVLV